MAAYDALLPRFRELRIAAAALPSPNPEDDLPIKLAIAGFSFHAPSEVWGYEHFLKVTEYRERELNHEALEGYDDEAPGCLEFSCLAVGYLLGLRQVGAINDTDTFLAEALLPGFLMLHVGTFGPDPGGAA